VVVHDLEFEKLDVKTGFFMKNLRRRYKWTKPFVVSGRKDLICKLKRSIYDLKQSPRKWYK
jgi:hypothetical protein